jgi:hypothetical protein
MRNVARNDRIRKSEPDWSTDDLRTQIISAHCIVSHEVCNSTEYDGIQWYTMEYDLISIDSAAHYITLQCKDLEFDRIRWHTMVKVVNTQMTSTYVGIFRTLQCMDSGIR